MRNRLAGAVALAGLSVLAWADPPRYSLLPEAARPFDPVESPKALLKTPNTMRQSEHQIGFDTRAVDIKEYVKTDSALGIDSVNLWQSHYAELSDYLEDALAAGRRDAMRRELVGHARFTDSAKQENRYELPVRIPEWARRLGLAKPALSFNGSYTAQIKANSNWSNLQEKAGTANKFPDFSPEQIPNVNLTGNIGKFVSMTLTWNQDGFGASQSQALHLKYAGEKPEDTEDDILQEAEFGEIQLALPGTSLTGYSEAASGLVGIRAKMRFGDVDLTVVGGSEQGQTQKQKIGRVAKEVVSTPINDRDMDIGRDFFPSYEHRRRWIENQGNTVVLSSPPTELRVFTRVKDQDRTNRPDWKPFYRGRAVARDSTMNIKESSATPDGYWRELSSLEWDWDRGVLRLRSGVAGTAVAVAWKEGSRVERGKVNGVSSVTDLVLLYDDDRQNDPDLRLVQLRNRYYRLGWVAEGDRASMKVRILDRNSSASDKSVNDAGIEWAKVFGLVDATGKVRYEDPTIFDWTNRAIIFPELEPFRKFDRGAIYDTGKTVLSQLSPRFAIEITSKTSSDSIKIGSRDMASVSGSNCVDIIEGSEVLTLNGSTRLERGIDYAVQYQTGTITLLSDRARDASADIQVDFSCRPFFSLETRTVAGARLEYQMPWIGKESVLGGTFLYRAESVTDPRPQLQREPNRAMLWGANLRLSGESEMLTDITSRIPFVRAKGDSKWRIELEGAQSWNNPNYEGYALVDDFESARQDNDLPVYAQSWFQASPPGGVPDDNRNGWGPYEDSLDFRHKGSFVWSSNSTELLRNIYNDYDDGDAAPQGTSILQLKLRPNELTGAGHSWGGIMRAFPSSWRDNSSARYLEVVVNGGGGELSFDFGQISEDLSIGGFAPNDSLNGENLDSSRASTGRVQNDHGLDGVPSTQERIQRWSCYGRNCVSQTFSALDSTNEVNDLAEDDYKADFSNNDPSAQVNGTEGNNASMDNGSNTWWDTEDLDRNSSLDRTNSFNRYTIRLGGRNASPAQKLRGGWKLYRIPLEEITLKKGSGADWTALRYVRISFHGLSTKNGANLFEQRVQIARMSLVGNQWKSVGRMAKNDSTYVVDSTATEDWTSTTKIILPDTARLSASVINNQDDNAVYRAWGVPNTEDASSGARLKEQSLRLVYKNLYRAFDATSRIKNDSGTAIRLFENARDFTLYRNLGLLLYHQVQGIGTSTDRKPVRVGIQFGSGVSDMANAPYYEYSYNPAPATCPIGEASCTATPDERVASMIRSWQDNQIHIPLSALTSLKTRRQNAGVSKDSLFQERYGLGAAVGGLDREDTLSIKGDPTLSAITWMRVWISPNQSSTSKTVSGEVWINDLKLDDPYDGIGTAVRGSAQMNFSDLLDLSASSDYQGGDFVPMGQKRPELSNQKSTAHASGTAALNLERFLPESWQARLPVNYTVSAGVDRPWAKADQSLTRDGLSEIASDWWDGDMRRDSSDLAVRNAKAYQTMTVSRTLSSSWSRSRDEGKGVAPFLVNTFFARPKLSWTYTEQGTLAPARRDSTSSHSIRFDYDFSPVAPPQWRPFSSSTSKWVPTLVQNLTIQPWPSVVAATLGDLDYIDGTHSVLDEDKDSLKSRTLERQAGLNHGLNTEWQVLDFLRWTGNVRSNRKWSQYDEAKRFDPASGLVDALPLIFDWDTTRVRIPGALGDGKARQEFGFLRNEDGRQVGFAMDFSPRILPWFTTTGGYQANASATREAATMLVTGSVGSKDTSSMQFWRHDHSDNFRGSVRLDVPAVFRTIQALGPDSWNKPVESAKQTLDRWRWSGIGLEYSVDNRTSGVRQTLDYMAFREGMDAWGLWRWQTGLGDETGMRTPVDWVTGSRSKSAFGQYDPARLDDPRRYPGLTDTLATESGADRASQVNTRSYRLSGSTEVTVPGLLMRVEPSLSYQIAWDERWREPWSVDTSVTWPQISVNTSFPNFAGRIPFLKGWLESMTASNTTTWERNQKIYPYRQTSNSDNKTIRLDPLVGIQAKTKGNWSFDNRFKTSYTRSLQRTKVALNGDGVCPESMGLPMFYSDTTVALARCFELKGNSQERTWDLGDEGTATYRIQTRKGIQILRWFVKLDNDLVVTFRGGWTRQWTDHDEVDPTTNEPAPTQRTKDVTTVYGGSNASYNFTSKLVAQFDAKYQQTASRSLTDLQEETVVHDISILASLQYRF